MKIIAILSKYEITEWQRDLLATCQNGCNTRIRYVFNESASVDCVCVINEPSTLFRMKYPRGMALKVVQEPFVAGSLDHRFVSRHSKKFSIIVGHSGLVPRGKFNSKVVQEFGRLFPTVSSSGALEKTKLLSIIASSLSILPGHRQRNVLINRVLDANPELAAFTYGRGRFEIDSKEEALDEFMYSLAIENSKSDHYFTEKVIDCFLRETVPIYFGAANLSDYFPPESFINLEDLSLEAFNSAVMGISREDYELRLPSVRRAKEIYLSKYKLCCLLDQFTQNQPHGEVITKFFTPQLISLLRLLAGRGLSFFQRPKS